MKCNWCEREIQEDERFYEIEAEFYCDNCIEEETVTYYEKQNGEKYEEREVNCYRNKEGYIQNVEQKIKFHKRAIDVYSEMKDELSKKITETAKQKIQKLEEQKKMVLGDDEG